MGDNPRCPYPNCPDPEIKKTIVKGCVFDMPQGYALASSGRVHLHDAYLTDARVGRKRTFWERLVGKNHLQAAPDYIKRDGIVIKGETPTWFLNDEGISNG